jgi:pimeloyl-ACP methyl ester carboxylesterase
LPEYADLQVSDLVGCGVSHHVRRSTPTLVITGRHDVAASPAAGQFLAACIEGARVIELGAAHLSNMQAPVVFEEALLGHCGRGLVQRARAKPAS